MRDDDIELLAIASIIAHDTLGHAFEPAMDEAIGHNNRLDEGLEPAGYVEVTDLEF